MSFDALIETIYEGPLEPNPWQGFLATLVDALGARAAVLTIRPLGSPRHGLLGWTHWPEDVDGRAWADRYTRDLYPFDPLADIPVGRAVTLRGGRPNAVDADSPFQREFMRPLALVDLIGIDGRDASGLEVQLRAASGAARRAFGPDEASLFDDLLPHLQRAARMHQRLSQESRRHDLLADAVAHIGIGLILLDERGRIARANRVARAILAARRGLHADHGSLEAVDPADAKRLREHVERIARLPPRSERDALAVAFRTAASGRGALQVVVRALPRPAWDDGQERPVVALFVQESRRSPPRVSAVQALFGLSRAEARLVIRLSAGASLAEAAAELAISRNTARNHLHAIFRKLGLSRQSELVGLVSGSLVHLG